MHFLLFYCNALCIMLTLERGNQKSVVMPFKNNWTASDFSFNVCDIVIYV